MQLWWKAQAACRGTDTTLFFPEDDDEIAAAQQVCAGCPVQQECLDHALGAREQMGIWGGATERERRRIIRQRRRSA